MIKYLDYNGVEVPYSIGYYALKRFKGETGTDFEKTPDDDLEALEIIAFYAIEAGCKITKIENPLKRDDMEFFLNECMNEFNESIPDFFQTPPKQKTTRSTAKRPTGGGKKTTPKKPSSRSTKRPPAK